MIGSCGQGVLRAVQKQGKLLTVLAVQHFECQGPPKMNWKCEAASSKQMLMEQTFPELNIIALIEVW